MLHWQMLQRIGDHLRYFGEGDVVFEKRFDSDLVGGIEYTRMCSTGLQGSPRKTEAWEGIRINRLEGQLVMFHPIEWRP